MVFKMDPPIINNDGDTESIVNDISDTEPLVGNVVVNEPFVDRVGKISILLMISFQLM